ncbi:hypothetical protein ABFT23_19875 [Nocardioides sp. C4-1]|uniref:hypothetical protein n=1 Tax=Nocardioides sp. C4-1 TaxID=3151851 RepID=UPI003267EB33
MALLGDRRVSVLLALVLAGSALCVGLALTRPTPAGAGDPPAAVGGLGDPPYEPAALRGPGRAALEAAVVAVPLTLRYDHRDLDVALEAATDRMTRRYARTFTRVFDERVRPFARRRAAVAEAVVRGAGVVRAPDDEHVTCLVYVDQLLLEAKGRADDAEPEVLGRNRAYVELVLVDGEWLVDDLRPL